MTAGGTGTRWDHPLLVANPAERAFGTRVLEVGDGTVTATTEVPPGTDSSGWLGPLADVLVARAAMTRYPDPMSCLTVDLRIDFLTDRALPAGTVVGRGTVLDLDGGFGLAEATVEDGAGRPVARCVGRLRIVPARPGEEYGTHGEADNPRTTLPLPALLGLRWREHGEDGGSLDIGGNPEVGNQAGVLHGGAQHSLLVVVAEEFARRGPGSWRALDATLSCLAPIPATGPDLTAVVAVAGRTRNLLRLGVEFRGARGLLATGAVALRRTAD